MREFLTAVALDNMPIVVVIDIDMHDDNLSLQQVREGTTSVTTVYNPQRPSSPHSSSSSPHPPTLTPRDLGALVPEYGRCFTAPRRRTGVIS